MSEQEVVDSPTGWVAEHIKQYVEIRRRRGPRVARRADAAADDQGPKVRRAAPHRADLRARRRRRRDRRVEGRRPEAPGWYLNLQANPGVAVQVGAEKFDATRSHRDRRRARRGCGRPWPRSGPTTTSTRPRPTARSRSSSSSAPDQPRSARDGRGRCRGASGRRRSSVADRSVVGSRSASRIEPSARLLVDRPVRCSRVRCGPGRRRCRVADPAGRRRLR